MRFRYELEKYYYRLCLIKNYQVVKRFQPQLSKSLKFRIVKDTSEIMINVIPSVV